MDVPTLPALWMSLAELLHGRLLRDEGLGHFLGCVGLLCQFLRGGQAAEHIVEEGSQFLFHLEFNTEFH